VRRRLELAVVVVVGALVSPRAALADESGEDARSQTPTSNRINVRLGSATTDSTGRPTICVDVRVFAGFGVESCGTGQGVIHDEPGTEMAHFRATWTVFERATAKGTGKLRAGAGFAELQVGVDHPGFHFGSPDSVDRGSVAGPEAALQGQWLVPLGGGVEAVASFTAGVAAFQSADQLVEPHGNVEPFASFELGLGW
jgi:hypothetical protein